MMANSSPLLIPMNAYALVVVNESQNYQRWRMNYNQARFFKPSEPTPPYTSTSNLSADPNARGVYLLWTLPWALRHGWQKSLDSGQIDFPLVPNRWLVVRYSGPAAGRTATAWVIESDFLDPVRGSSPYTTQSAADPPVATHIGRAVPLASWRETINGPLFLRATAPANELFTFYQPANENVFSFHDNLVTQGNLRDTLSYFVAGWYSDVGADILQGWQAGERGNDYPDLLSRLHWVVSDPSRSARTILCHAMVHGIAWDDSGPLPISARDQVKQVHVGVGNSAVDALAALIQAQDTTTQGLNKNDARLLQAFQYNLLALLDQPGGEDRLDQRIRDAWFGSNFGGTVWKSVDLERAPGTPAPPPLSVDQIRAEAGLLADLNQAQTRLDQQSFQLQSLRHRLYELWWKSGYSSQQANQPAGTSPADFQQALDPNHTAGMPDPSNPDPHYLAAQVHAQMSVVAGQQAIVDKKVRTVRSMQVASRQLKATNAPPFWLANAPLVVLTGASPGTDLALETDQALQTRYSDQVVTGLTVKIGDTSQTITAVSHGLSQLMPALNLANIPQPDVITALLMEFFFLDPYNAPGLAANVLGNTSPTVVDALIGAMTNGTGAITTGKLEGLDLSMWVQPWLPLYFEWAVNWYPIPFAQDNTPHWNFDGVEYHWDGTLTSLPQAHQIAGRSFLTPKLAFTFRSRLSKFLKYRPNEADLQSLLNSVGLWDFLSQSLTGFIAQVALRDSLSNLAPDVQLANLVEKDYQMVPQSLDYAYDGPLPPPDTYSTFEGLCCGQFYFTRLTVVDRFGQTVEVVNDQNSAIFVPVPDKDLLPDVPVLTQNPARFIQVPPRLLQPARLDFTLVSANDDAQELDLAPLVNPVCGFLLPNHLDGGLIVYDPVGTHLGELRIGTDINGKQQVVWEAFAESKFAVLTDLVLPYPHLGGFLIGLQAREPGAFQDFLVAIDETLWTVDPAGEGLDPYLPVLVGRPIALARAKVQLALELDPLEDPAWPLTFFPRKPTFLNYPFAIRMGDQNDRQDGLLGFFNGGDYSQFNTVHLPDSSNQPPDHPPYLKRIGAGNFLNLRFNGPPAYLTLLLDPRAEVGARTGLLPVRPLTIPPEFIESALRSLEITFQTGPLLVSKQLTTTKHSANGLQLGEISTLLTPLPAEKNGQWSWLERQADQWFSQSIQDTDANARLANNPLTLREGLLKLTGATDETPAPESFNVFNI